MTQSLRRTLLACLVAPLALAACGGGGFEAPPSAQSQSAEGAWVGSITGASGNKAHVLVLEDGEYWAAYGSDVGVLSITGFVQGNGVSDKGLFTSTNARDFAAPTPVDLPVSGTYVRNSRLVADIGSTVMVNAVTWPLTVTDTVTNVYDYDTPATAAAVSGEWVVQGSDGLAYSLTVSSGAGTLTGYARGCLVNGKLTPRLSHKNVYDVTLTFGASPCADAGGSYRGVVFLEPKKLTFSTATEEESIQLIGLTVNPDRSKGFAFSAAYKTDRTLGMTVPVGW